MRQRWILLSRLRWLWIACLLLTANVVLAESRIRLIAHRGGIVDGRHAENSPGAIEAAIARDYWMLEIDVRESKDGRLVVHHDPDFRRFYGDPRRVSDLSWDEIRRLRATPGGSRPLTFEEVAGLCRNKVRLMVDTKPPDHPEAFYQSMEESLHKNDLLKTAYIIGTPQSREYFRGKARVGVDRRGLQRALKDGEAVSKRYFLFEHGRDLDAEAVSLANRMNVPLVASVNVFHYEGVDHMKAARADIERLRMLGVEYFQIDSVYEGFVRRGPDGGGPPSSDAQ